VSQSVKALSGKLRDAIEEYCDACISNDGFCKPMALDNDCGAIAPIKEQISALLTTAELIEAEKS